MDFRSVLRLIGKDFHKEGVRYALMGGFALGAQGAPRATIDLDFIINSDDWLKVDGILKTRGYRCLYKSDEVAQYVSKDRLFGEVDFILAHRNISRKMLERAEEKEIFSMKVRVLLPEDIIGLKIQALANDKTRAAKEYLDIESLLGFHKNKLDWIVLKDYFKLFDLGGKYEEYRKRFHA